MALERMEGCRAPVHRELGRHGSEKIRGSSGQPQFSADTRRSQGGIRGWEKEPGGNRS